MGSNKKHYKLTAANVNRVLNQNGLLAQLDRSGLRARQKFLRSGVTGLQVVLAYEETGDPVSDIGIDLYFDSAFKALSGRGLEIVQIDRFSALVEAKPDNCAMYVDQES